MPATINVQFTSFNSPDLPNDKPFADKAIVVIYNIVNNSTFQQTIANANYSRRLFQQDDDSYIEGTNALLMEVLTTGRETRTVPNDIIELQVSLQKLAPRVIGGMTPPNPLIVTNTDFFNDWSTNNDPVSLAAHWIHEWLHVAGFRHASSHPDFNDLPYQVGYIAADIGKTLPMFKNLKKEHKELLGESYKEASKYKGSCFCRPVTSNELK